MKSRILDKITNSLLCFKAQLNHLFFSTDLSSLNDKDIKRSVYFYSNKGWKILIFGFGGLLLWSILAPLDRGVTAIGWVVTDGNRKVVQNVNAGIVEEIFVREGDYVKAGQLLIRLNSVNASSNLIITNESIQNIQSQIDILQQSIQQRKIQLKNTEELAKEGFYPRNRVIEQKNAISADEATTQSLKRELATQRERIAPATLDLENTEIKSPVDGYVVNLQAHTKGGVVNSGSKLMEVVPVSQPLVVEAQIPVHLIDKVHEGQEVEMLFTAFNQNRTPNIPGIVIVVGDDRIVDERSGMPYFKLLAEATSQGKKLLGDNKVRPGMPVDVFVKTGERTMLSYLLKPLLDRMHSSMRED